MWYLTYRRDGSTRMRVFKTRDLALHAACEMLGDREDDGLEVGPMLAPRDGNVFRGARSATCATATPFDPRVDPRAARRRSVEPLG